MAFSGKSANTAAELALGDPDQVASMTSEGKVLAQHHNLTILEEVLVLTTQFQIIILQSIQTTVLVLFYLIYLINWCADSNTDYSINLVLQFSVCFN